MIVFDVVSVGVRALWLLSYRTQILRPLCRLEQI